MSNKGNKQTPQTKLIIREKQTKITTKQLIEDYKNYISHLSEFPDTMPSIVNFCILSGLNSTYIYELATQNSKLTEILNNIKELQENYLLTNGIINKTNSNLTIFLLKAKHNYKDNSQKLEQNNYLNISPEVLSDALKLMNKKTT
jgi:hypothetical protein